ncbi:MFS transporter [Acinetobacter nosocomialis]|uniref:MFS transporter n=1 Tax=Acinetobacter nosocomialis TaxID=106654 RepID=UPI003AF467E1
MQRTPKYLEPMPNWTETERPALIGSPASIEHPNHLRVAYLFIGVFIALSASLGNGLIISNALLFQGEFGLTPSEAAWLPAAFVIGNTAANLYVIKIRQQFGLRLFAEISLVLCCICIGLHLLVNSYEMALAVQFFAGIVAAPLTSMSAHYVIQSFKKPSALKGIYVILGLQQFGLPLAWMISPGITHGEGWTDLAYFELGLYLCCLAMVVSLKLPRSIRAAVLEKADIFPLLFIFPAIALFSAVLVQGPIVWWFNNTWIAYALALGFVLLVIGLVIEHHRQHPLIVTQWLVMKSTLTFMIGAFSIRILMSEQNYAVGHFLQAMGLLPEQLVGLYGMIGLGVLVGSVASILTFKQHLLMQQLLVAELLILIGCGLDLGLTHDIRPHNLYLSQFLIGCAGGIFMGPLVLIGYFRVLQHSQWSVVTFAVLLGITQNLGGLIGTSFFSTYQQHQTRLHQNAIYTNLDTTNATVESRLQIYSNQARQNSTDPNFQQNYAQKSLNQVVTREAQVLAFNDVIKINALLATLVFIFGVTSLLWTRYSARKQA